MDGRHTQGQAQLRLRDRSGRWLVLHASCLADLGGDPATERSPSSSSRPKAGTSFLSPHTVRDYIKSLFAEHYSDPMPAAAAHVD